MAGPTGAELRERYGKPTSANAGDALRALGLRSRIHPDDVVASQFPSQEAADAFANGNLEHWGHPHLGSYVTDDGVIGVTDLRHVLGSDDLTDPAKPD